GQHDGHEDEPSQVLRLLDQGVAEEEEAQGEPPSRARREVQGVQRALPSAGGLERAAQPHHHRPDATQPAQGRDHDLDGAHGFSRPAPASNSTTRSSLTCGKSPNHWPTAKKWRGATKATTSSASDWSRRMLSAGATGTASTTRVAPRARAHRSAATAVPPVATPSSTTTATLPVRSTGDRPLR